MMNDFELINECTSILNRCLNDLPPYIRYDRTRKVETLKKLASDIREKAQKQSTDPYSIGSIGISASTGASIGGAMLGPFGMVAGGIGGALLGKTFRSISSMFNTDSHSYEVDNVGEKIVKRDWKILLVDPNLTIRLIRDQIIDTLYPRRLDPMDVEMLMTLAEVPANSMIETINCDLGIVAEIERYSGRQCISDGLTEFEKGISNLCHMSFNKGSNVVSLIVLMTENIVYRNTDMQPYISVLKDLMPLCLCVKQLQPKQHLIAIVPKHMLYNPGFQKIRKALFMNDLFKAIIDLKHPMHSSQTELSAIIFSGNKSERILVLSNTWDEAISVHIGGHTSEKKLHNAIMSAVNTPPKMAGWQTVSYRSIGAPYIITPSYRSKKKQGKNKKIELGKVALVEQPCKRKYTSVCGWIIGPEHLTKEKPLKPINKGSLDIEEMDDLSKWYHIETDHVVFLHIWNGRIFTGYMENVKGENFFLHGSSCRILILGVNEDSGISPQYMAQILQSEKYGISQQLLGAAYYADNLQALRSTIGKAYIPQPSIANQNKVVAETAVQILEQNNLYWERKFREYNTSIRERKHALSQVFSGLRGASERLIKYCRSFEGEFNLQTNIGGTSTVEDVINRIEEKITEIGSKITNIAEIDYNFGECTEFNIIEELRDITAKWIKDGIEVYEEGFDCSSTNTMSNRIKFPIMAFRQILANIYFNAQIHGFTENQANKVIKLRWHLEGDIMVIRIANNGAPLSTSNGDISTATIKTNMQNKGHQSERIGYNQSKRLMEEYKGSISLDSIKEDDFKVAYTLKFKIS